MKKHLKIALKKLPTKQYIQLADIYNKGAAWFYESKSCRKGCKNVFASTVHPLIYISQAPRCGGTLLKRMFDGHPDLNVVPGELNWQKNGYEWSKLSANDAATFRILYDRWIPHAMVNGIDLQTPFRFSRRTHRKLFLHGDIKDTRLILDRYLQSFFASWSDFSGQVDEGKYHLAFCPWNSAPKEETDRFFSIFPDGCRIHVIRSPHAWWASEKKYFQEGKSLSEYLHRAWYPSCRDGVERQKERPDRYLLVNYEKLVMNPEESMKILCGRIGIQYHPCLLTPSVNSVPTRANSSHHKDKLGETGVTRESLEKWRNILTASEIEEIEHEVGDLYDRAIAGCVNT